MDELDIELFVELSVNFQSFGTHAWMDLKISTTRRLHGTISALLYRQLKC